MTSDEHGQVVSPQAESNAPRRSTWRRRLTVWGLSVAAVVVIAAGATAGYLAWTNKQRADTWEARAQALENRTEALDAVVVERTSDLNQRTVELNRMASKVTRAQVAIKRSEADVRRLEKRQRELAAEKADVEDARAALALEADALQGVAQAYINCKEGLADLLTYVLNEDYYSANAIVNDVNADCNAADGSLDEYLASYE